MPKEADFGEQEFKERVRDAIQAGGKSGAMSKRTGIPVDTLNKYVSLRSTPNALNVLRIANALNITVEQLARGELTPTVTAVPTDVNPPKSAPGFNAEHGGNAPSLVDIDNPNLALGRKILREVRAAFDGAALEARADDLDAAAVGIGIELRTKVQDMSDMEEVELALAQLLHNLRRDLRKAAERPGYSKRSAS